MSEREALGRVMHDAVTARARSERANVATWEQLAPHFRENFLRQAEAVIAAGWSRGGSLFDLEPADQGHGDRSET